MPSRSPSRQWPYLTTMSGSTGQRRFSTWSSKLLLTLKFLAAFERNPWSSCTTLHLSLDKSLNTALWLVQKLAGSTGASKCLQKFKCVYANVINNKKLFAGWDVTFTVNFISFIGKENNLFDVWLDLGWIEKWRVYGLLTCAFVLIKQIEAAKLRHDTGKSWRTFYEQSKDRS